MSRDAAHWIRVLGLSPHPEGGHYRETWRSPETVAKAALPGRFDGPRALGTAIVYLLPAGETSMLHRLRADEVWHLYDGGPLHLHLLHPDKGHERIVLGRDVERGEVLQAVVPHGTWFGAETPAGTDFALVGCTVAPGFEFTDFELGSRRALLAEFPAQRDWIVRLTAAGE
jgi:predicted cupin superfamily sugar epimerase